MLRLHCEGCQAAAYRPKFLDDFRRALIANYGGRADLERKLGQNAEYSWEKEIPVPPA